MKKIFYFSKKEHEFVGADLITENAEIPKYATTVDPFNTDSLIYDPIIWNGTDWTYGTKEEWEKSHPSAPTAPTETDQLKLMVGNLISENAKKDQSIKQLQTMTGSLVAQIAELNKGGK